VLIYYLNKYTQLDIRSKNGVKRNVAKVSDDENVMNLRTISGKSNKSVPNTVQSLVLRSERVRQRCGVVLVGKEGNAYL